MTLFYQGYSPEFNAIADRRRLLYWARMRAIEIAPFTETTEFSNNDIVVISSAGNFPLAAKLKTFYPNIRLIFDVVDGIHGEKSRFRDLVRGVAYCLTKRVSSRPMSLNGLLKRYLPYFDHLICSSQEQEILWQNFFGGTTSTILDFHNEIPNQSFEPSNKGNLTFLWEGLPYTLKHIQELRNLFRHFPDSRLEIVTGFGKKKFLNRFIDINPLRLVEKSIPDHLDSITVTPWTVENLLLASRKCSFGVIPIVGESYFDYLKAENRLLIMWRLGIPTLTGPLPSYKRLQDSIGIEFVCESRDDWSRKVLYFQENYERVTEYLTRAKSYLETNHREDLLLDKWDKAILGKSKP